MTYKRLVFTLYSMNASAEKNCIELIEILSDHDADADEMAVMAEPLKLALSNPKKFLEENPDDSWLAEGFDLSKPNPKLAENIFAWTLSASLVNFVAIGEKADQLFDSVLDLLFEMEIEIDDLEFELPNWSAYTKHIEEQLVKHKTGKRIISLDINFSEDISVFVISQKDYPRLLELINYFHLKVVPVN